MGQSPRPDSASGRSCEFLRSGSRRAPEQLNLPLPIRKELANKMRLQYAQSFSVEFHHGLTRGEHDCG